MSRAFTTRRQGIVNALVDKLKDIDGTGFFRANVNEMFLLVLNFGTK